TEKFKRTQLPNRTRARAKTLGSGFLHRAALVVAAMRAGLVRLLHFVAVGALGQGRFGEAVVGAARAGPSLGVPSFWVRHSCTPRSRLVWADCMGIPPGNLLLFKPVLL